MQDRWRFEDEAAASDWEPMERGIFSERRPLRIGFVGISEGVGTTTVAAAAAAAIGKQYGRTVFLADAAQRDGKASAAESLCLTKALKGGRQVLYQNVNWQLQPSGKKLPAGGYVIADQPPQTQWHACDVLVGVIDPLPSRILAGIKRYRLLREEENQRLLRQEKSLLWVQNKANAAADARETERFLKLRFDAALPLLPQEFFYEAEYQQRPWLAKLYERSTFSSVANSDAEGFRLAAANLASSIFAALPQFAI